MRVTSPRMNGFIRAKEPQGAPDFDKYRLRHETLPLRCPNGTAVAYSTEGAIGYAPFRGKPGCIDRTGRLRVAHSFDGDGVCYWCNTLDPEQWPEVRQ